LPIRVDAITDSPASGSSRSRGADASRAYRHAPTQGSGEILKGQRKPRANADCIDPTNKLIRAYGSLSTNGWPNSPPVEAEVAALFDATTLDGEKIVARRLNKAALDHVVYAPLGLFPEALWLAKEPHRRCACAAAVFVLFLMAQGVGKELRDCVEPEMFKRAAVSRRSSETS
jgi:hypothetical protein